MRMKGINKLLGQQKSGLEEKIKSLQDRSGTFTVTGVTLVCIRDLIHSSICDFVCIIKPSVHSVVHGGSLI